MKNLLFPGAPEVEEESEDAGPTEEALANPVECAPGVLDLTAEVAGDTLPAGQAANIPVKVHNTGEVPCLMVMDKTSLQATITSGGDTVWSSKDCGAGLPEERRILLDVDASDTTVITWPGTRSDSGCGDDQPAAKPGTYRIAVEVNSGGETLTEERVFGLE